MKTDYNNTDEQIIQMLTPKVEVRPSADLRSRILAAAQQQSAAQPTKPRHGSLRYWIGAAASMAAVVAIAITFTLSSPAYAARKTALDGGYGLLCHLGNLGELQPCVYVQANNLTLRFGKSSK